MRAAEAARRIALIDEPANEHDLAPSWRQHDPARCAQAPLHPTVLSPSRSVVRTVSLEFPVDPRSLVPRKAVYTVADKAPLHWREELLKRRGQRAHEPAARGLVSFRHACALTTPHRVQHPPEPLL